MPDITIIMPSFNKEKYIKEAIDSVLMQKTKYSWQIIVADDCSTDKTVDIVKEYQQKYSDKIILLTSETNQKLYKNVLRAYEITKTDYFCVLDPDDYWTDEHKIEKALDFLEKNKDYTIYVTNTVINKPDGTKELLLNEKAAKNFTFEDVFTGNAVFGCTLGSTFRNVVFKAGLPDKMINLETDTAQQSYRGDTFRTFIHLHKGKAHYEPDNDAIYRVTEEGIYQGTSNLERNILNMSLMKDIWLYFDKKYPQFLLSSYNYFNSIKSVLFNELEYLNDEKKLKIINKLISINKFYEENKDILISDKSKNKVSLKNKIRLAIYKSCRKKLEKQGLI